MDRDSNLYAEIFIERWRYNRSTVPLVCGSRTAAFSILYSFKLEENLEGVLIGMTVMFSAVIAERTVGPLTSRSSWNGNSLSFRTRTGVNGPFEK